MLLVKLIRVAFLLKDLKLDAFFNDKGCDVTALVESLPKDLTMKLCDVTGVKADNEVDAVIGLITDFFIPLLTQLKESKRFRQGMIDLVNSKLLLESLTNEQRVAILNLCGKISIPQDCH